MKKPILNEFKRQSIYLDTYNGAWNELYITWLHLLRDIDKELTPIAKWLEDNEAS